VKSWLACTDQRWLLIIDNADDREIDYSKYIPSGKRGDILFTTRNPECVTYNTMGSETLGDLEPELARKLLLQATDIGESRWKEKEEAAAAVVDILGSHTLAVIQAGAFVRQKLCTLEQYPSIFQQQKEQLLKYHSKQRISRYGNVYSTFEVSAEHLQNSKSPENLDALNLLHILAFMHNSGISERMFQRASEYASELKDRGTSSNEEIFSLSVRHVARLPEYAQQGWSSLQDRLRWRKACAILESLSIITLHTSDDFVTISAHPLIHAWAKQRQDYQSQCRAWQSAAMILALSCEGWHTFHPFFVFLQPHIRACISHEIEDYTQKMSDMETAQTFFQFAHVLIVMKDKTSSGLLLQRLPLRLHDEYRAGQEIALQIKRFAGLLSLQQGEYREAVELLKHVVQVREKLAEDDHNRLVSQHELARVYQVSGQVNEAIELLEHVVKVREKLAEDHPNRLGSQIALGRAYQANGQVNEAIELLEHVVKVGEKLAEDDLDQLVSQHELARAYHANGQVNEAIELLEHVVKVQEKLAEDHPDRLASQHELARAYQANGQIDKAKEVKNRST
jgi:tetratricopeptide (TPR) repeat protein